MEVTRYRYTLLSLKLFICCSERSAKINSTNGLFNSPVTIKYYWNAEGDMELLIYLLSAFGIPWITWIMLALNGLFDSPIYIIVSALLMWIPAASCALVHLIGKAPAIRFSWKPSIGKNIGYYATALLIPILLAFLGSAIYFMFFSDAFTPQNIESTALPIPQYILLAILETIPASLVNMLFALGEEIGWRGFLYPEFSLRFGKVKACILTGIIWGLWHTPVNIMGHNYGLGYPGYPVTGVLAMCFSCIVLGAWCSYLADKTGSIWTPALFHGAVNAIGSSGLIFLRTGSSYLMGPGITGIIPSIIAGAPLILLLAYRKKKVII